MAAESKKTSYSNLIKAELLLVPTKKDCCRRALIDGVMLARGGLDGDVVSICSSSDELVSALPKLLHACYGVSTECETVAGDLRRISFESDKVRNRFLYLTANDAVRVASGKCAACRAAFLRGAFLACGRFTDPNKSFQLELSLGSRAEEMVELLALLGMESRVTSRKGETVVYVKSSATIEDFLTYIGANNAVFELMNIKIEKEIRNNVNRIANCETNNINKAVSAAAVQLEAIRYLKENNLLSSLPQEISETADLRFANPELSISQLCIVSGKEISKSGMNHRLSKIVDAYKQALSKAKHEAKGANADE